DVHDAAHGHGDHHHDHEPAIMIVPLVVLAVGALIGGFFNFPFHWLGSFLGNSPSFEFDYIAGYQAFGTDLHGAHLRTYDAGFGYAGDIGWLGLFIGAAVALAGIGTAYYLHLVERGKAASLAHTFRPLAKLLEGKYWVDEIYDALIVRPLRGLGRVLYVVDWAVVDGVVWLLSFIPQLSGLTLRLATQRGHLQGYALSMLLGVAVILLLMFL